MIISFAASSLILPITLKHITIAFQNKSFAESTKFGFVIFIFFILQGGLNFFQNTLAAKLNQNLLKSMRDSVFSYVLKL